MKNKEQRYTDIFFDLDGTLWDFETNSLETLKEIYENHQLEQAGIPDFEQFIQVYHKHNVRLWNLYRAGDLEKEVLKRSRFGDTLNDFGIDNSSLIETIAHEYVSISPTKTNLFQHTHQTLSYLKGKYRLHIITNGFNEVQFIKLEKSGLSAYFNQIFTSEMAGISKPDARIFNYALNLAGASAENSLMIGDDEEVDIQGALNVGMDALLFTHDNPIAGKHHCISSLAELQHLL